LRKHSVEVSRWVSQGRQLREDYEDFLIAVEALDKALSELAIRQRQYSGHPMINKEREEKR
jgi:hypothetical protein